MKITKKNAKLRFSNPLMFVSLVAFWSGLIIGGIGSFLEFPLLYSIGTYMVAGVLCNMLLASILYQIPGRSYIVEEAFDLVMGAMNGCSATEKTRVLFLLARDEKIESELSSFDLADAQRQIHWALQYVFELDARLTERLVKQKPLETDLWTNSIDGINQPPS